MVGGLTGFIVFLVVLEISSCLDFYVFPFCRALNRVCSLTLQVTKQHNDDCKKLLGLMGVPVVEVILFG